MNIPSQLGVPSHAQLLHRCYKCHSPLMYSAAHTPKVFCEGDPRHVWEDTLDFLTGYKRWTRCFIAISVILASTGLMWAVAALLNGSLPYALTAMIFALLTFLATMQLPKE